MIKLSQFIPKNLIEEVSPTYKIYLDMDGVLSAFNKAFSDISDGVNPEEYENKYGAPQFWQLIEKAGLSFWVDMEWEEGAKALWQFSKPYQPTILSAPSRSPLCKKGKRIWCAKHLGSSIPVILDKHKEKYASPNSILIDDRKDNVKKWINAGGIGILHISSQTTLVKLKKILSQGVEQFRPGVDTLNNQTDVIEKGGQ